METVEILLKKLENLEQLNNIDIEKLLEDKNIYYRCQILNLALNILREKRKLVSIEKNTALRDFYEGIILKEDVRIICNKYDLIIKYIGLLEKKLFEVKKKIKSNRIKLHQEEKKTKPKPENKKNNYNYKKINIDLENDLNILIRNEKNIKSLQILIKKFKNNSIKLIQFYNGINNGIYCDKINDLDKQLIFLEKIDKLIANKDADDNIINKLDEFKDSNDLKLKQEEIEALKCFILQIKQLYIKNIKLYNNINSKHEKIEYINCEVRAIEKIINTLDKMLKSFEHKPIREKKEKTFISKEDNLDFNYFRNIIFNGNSENLISILGSNPEICLLKNNNCEYLFEEYLNYIKNLIINSNSKMEDLYEFSKKILVMEKIINEYHYLELEDIYNQFINQFLNTVENLKIKNFDKKHLELANKFLKMINIEPCVKSIVDSDKFIEQIYSYHNNMNNIRSDFDYNHIITIDNNEAKLLDTAYSFRKDKQGNYYVGIYIKDMNDLLEKFDLEELYSKFIRNKRMFNHDFGFHNLSLSVSRNYHKVLGHHFVLDRNFKVKSLKIRKEIVAISNNLKYDDVREIITSDKNENLREILKLYHLIGNNIIDCKRKYSLYNNVGIDSLNHNIMIFFNYYMASFCKCNNIPSIFLTDKYYSNKTISDQIPYSKYSCPARNFVSLINQLIYGIYMYNNIPVDETTKIVEMLENYATNMNYNSHDSDLKKAKKKHLSN